MSKKVMLSVNELVGEINCRDEVFAERGMCKHYFPSKNEELLHLVFTKSFCEQQDSDFQQNLSGRTLSDLLNAKGGKSAVVGERLTLAHRIGKTDNTARSTGAFTLIAKALTQFETIFSPAHLHENFTLKKLPGVYEALIEKPVRPVDWIAHNSSTDKQRELEQTDKQLDIIRKFILHLYGTIRYPEFFWWLFLFAIFQNEIVHLLPCISEYQYKHIIDYLEAKNGNIHVLRENALVQVTIADFMDLRRRVVETAKGHLILAGPSLKNAFDVGNKHNIMKQLRNAIRSDKLTRITIMLTDPLLFQGTKCYAPVRAIDGTVSSLEDSFYELCERNGVDLHVYFLMLPQIDHAVISEEFMLFRSNKLWTDQRELKGSYTLYTADYYTSEISEYRAHADYLNLIMTLSNDSHPEIDVDHEDWDRQDMRYYHRQWRKHLRNSGYSHVHFHYLFSNQLHSYMCQTWLPMLE